VVHLVVQIIQPLSLTNRQVQVSALNKVATFHGQQVHNEVIRGRPLLYRPHRADKKIGGLIWLFNFIANRNCICVLMRETATDETLLYSECHHLDDVVQIPSNTAIDK